MKEKLSDKFEKENGKGTIKIPFLFHLSIAPLMTVF
jgi:hypothetical protein